METLNSNEKNGVNWKIFLQIVTASEATCSIKLDLIKMKIIIVD